MHHVKIITSTGINAVNLLLGTSAGAPLGTSVASNTLTITSNAPFTRLEIVKHLESYGIQTRPVFSGNILRQPGFKNIKYKDLGKEYKVANNIMKNSFLIGCNHGLDERHMNRIKMAFTSFLENK